jgi:tetratricopeptide (TPR) repeat protein
MFSLLDRRAARRVVYAAVPILFSTHVFLSSAQTSAPDNAFAKAPTVAVDSRQAAAAPARSDVALSAEQQGDLLMARGNYAAAIRAYQEGPRNSAVLWNKIGVAYHHLFALDEARKAYDAALAIEPHYPSALNNLAAVYYGKRDYKRAERTYKRALKYQPRVAVTYSNLGTAYFAQGKYKKGMVAYETAFRLDPNVFNPDNAKRVEEVSSRQQVFMIHYYLARRYASAGKKDVAVAYLRKAFGEGFIDRKLLIAERDFDPIRSTPEFQQFLSEEHID